MYMSIFKSLSRVYPIQSHLNAFLGGGVFGIDSSRALLLSTELTMGDVGQITVSKGEDDGISSILDGPLVLVEALRISEIDGNSIVCK